MKVLLELAYDGGAYHGWQVQPGAVTVQQTLQDACEHIFGDRLPVTGCSRTDAGVHARQFFATVEGAIRVPCERIPAALNSLLPSDISVKGARAVAPEFHARYSCLGKEYIYDICVGLYRDPLMHGRCWQLCRPLDLDLMEVGAQQLVGKHDFASFCAAHSSVSDTVRCVQGIGVRQEGDHVFLSVAADGFLYHMVRIITGTLVSVGIGRLPADSVGDILHACNRSAAGATAPPDGLYLNRVFYDF